jgi:hypothetical protein
MPAAAGRFNYRLVSALRISVKPALGIAFIGAG